MVTFNELKVTYDNKKLIIDVKIDNLPIYEDLYISEISIDTQNTYKNNTPSEKAIKVFTSSNNEKSIRLELDDTSLGTLLDNNLLFVYVKTKDSTFESTNTSLGITFNTYIVYNQLMQYIKTLDCNCSIPKEFIDYYLRFKGLEVSVNTCHYIQACSIYNKYIKPKNFKLTLNCGCYA